MAKSKLESLSTADLQTELRRRSRGATALQKKRDRLLSQLAGVESELASLGELPKDTVRRSTAAGTSKRPKNTMTLVEALTKSMKGQAMKVPDIEKAVKAVGYKSSAANFRTIINQTLINNDDVFKRVARGEYTVKK